jgi:hypothetical protein
LQLTGQVLKATGTKTGAVAGDGTVMEAAASRYRILREEALKQGLTIAAAGVASPAGIASPSNDN